MEKREKFLLLMLLLENIKTGHISVDAPPTDILFGCWWVKRLHLESP